MKKIGVCAAFTAFVSMLAILAGGVADATVQFTGIGTGTATTAGSFNFTFTDVYTYPPFTSVGGNGDFVVSGSYVGAAPAFFAPNSSYDLTNFDFSLGGVSYITGGTASIELVGNNLTLAGEGTDGKTTLVYDADIQSASSNPTVYTTSGLTGHYTTAPESSSLLGFGAIFSAGMILFFGSKRKLSEISV
jgi:hypothetical protein